MKTKTIKMTVAREMDESHKYKSEQINQAQNNVY